MSVRLHEPLAARCNGLQVIFGVLRIAAGSRSAGYEPFTCVVLQKNSNIYDLLFRGVMHDGRKKEDDI
jgi:hypothetical protein